MSCGPSVPSPVAGVASLKQVSSQDRTEAAGAARLPEQPPGPARGTDKAPGPPHLCIPGGRPASRAFVVFSPARGIPEG